MDEQIGTYVNGGRAKEIKKNVDDEEDGDDGGAAAVDSEGSIIQEEKAVRCPISKTSSLPACAPACLARVATARSSWLLSPPMLSMVSPSLLLFSLPSLLYPPPFGLLDVNTK